MRCLLAETGPTGISLAIPPSLETTGAAWTAAIPTPSRGSSSTETNAERGRQSRLGETVGEVARTADETEWAACMGGGSFCIKLPFSLVFVSRLIGLPQLRPLLSPEHPLHEAGGTDKGDPLGGPATCPESGGDLHAP
jgi:hypothetical protein